ncbi:thymidine phosphorylase [Zavarzinella formosa]|uniref:thymidine phosphorylase n=1 Tax=Zavarzinella formosa TaxID=360055 RepID=UPI0002D6E396|nr:thymidine phosphorylase [Zavarzinella formosa]
MRAIDIIRTKRDGQPLSPEAIQAFVSAAANGGWEDYQLTALLMAVWLRGMNPDETARFTKCMAESGKSYRWDDIPGPKVDKHSTGGVGDKTSLILAPLAACCGLVVPMMSGRGLGHSGGTLDKLEAIPGFRVGLSEDELRTALRTVGVGMIGQSAEVAPADRKLYMLRDATSTVESIPLITASILSKKLAEGIDSLVMDVKVGLGGFMKTLPDARALAKSIVSVGNANGVRTEAMITRMDAPLGRMVGNALEVQECIDALRGEAPVDITDLSVALAARMVEMGNKTDPAKALADVQKALKSGAGLEKFRKIIEQQGGDPRVIDDPKRLPQAPHRHILTANRPGVVHGLEAFNIGIAATMLGAGRAKAADHVDHAVGVRVLATVGSTVREGDGILEVHYSDPAKLKTALPLLEKAINIGDGNVTPENLVVEEIKP